MIGPVCWRVNDLQMEIFWFRVQNCSFCVCELLAFGGVSLNSCYETGETPGEKRFGISCLKDIIGTGYSITSAF